ncbi:hypothetical protein GCM10025880_29380 [Methylorubrum aminovorans]|nr:hypothetical protein [Methylorubrum aminovorans]GMA76521.1 hypothetical protein GCM10025880_29380 [Methylorubrum aminovorans]
MFLASYEPGPNEKSVPLPLRSTAFSYDNALAATALAACGDLRRARQIGEAFLAAIESDRTFEDGRIRNAYRAGPVRERPVLLPGWWDAANNRWFEDRYQDGTATGNVAWVALALLNLRDATQDPASRKRPPVSRAGFGRGRPATMRPASPAGSTVTTRIRLR